MHFATDPSPSSAPYPTQQRFAQGQFPGNHHHNHHHQHHQQQFLHSEHGQLQQQQQQHQQQNASSAGRSCPQLALILITLFMLLTAIILAVIAVMNPSWQIVDIREFQAEHHHGLYTDCTRAERRLSAGGAVSAGNRKLDAFVDRSPLHCTYKFDQHALDNIEAQIHDIDSNAAAAEAEQHQFHGWKKAVLVFIGLSLIACAFSMIMGLCAPCTPACAVLHSIASFFAFLCAVTAASIFFFAAHRVDSRFVQGLVGTYEQQIGEAFYCYLISCVLLMLVFILSIIGAYHALRTSLTAEESAAMLTREQMTPLATGSGAWRETGWVGKTSV
uniref:Clc-like protein n=1 Tax=Globodera rostochiensis TaxID=31243 RepID=A0A914HRR3_GLORO